MWRLFYNEEDSSFDLYNLARLHCTGFERTPDPESDHDFKEEYQWLEALGYRLASSHDFIYYHGYLADQVSFVRWERDGFRIGRVPIYIHYEDGEDYMETDNSVLVRCDGDEGQNEFEEDGYFTIEPQGKTSVDVLEQVEASILHRLDLLEVATLGPMETRISDKLDGLTHGTDKRPLDHLPKRVASVPENLHSLLINAGIFPDKTAFSTSEVAKVLEKLGKKGKIWTIRNVWCSQGYIECEKVDNSYRISLKGLLEAINRAQEGSSRHSGG